MDPLAVRPWRTLPRRRYGRRARNRKLRYYAYLRCCSLIEQALDYGAAMHAESCNAARLARGCQPLVTPRQPPGPGSFPIPRGGISWGTHGCVGGGRAGDGEGGGGGAGAGMGTGVGSDTVAGGSGVVLGAGGGGGVVYLLGA